MQLELLDGWVPVDLSWSDRKPIVEWVFLGPRRFTSPFFNDTINESFRHPFSQLFHHKTSIETLKELGQKQPGLTPTGFIFHMSRCGSTLVSQMLASLPGTVMLSEPPPVDHVLRARFQDDEMDANARVELLRSMLSALGQRRTGNENHLFVKFDCWSVLDFDVISRAFPEVPWIFLFREPVRVLASQLRSRGQHTVPGQIQPELFGFEPGEVARIKPEEYCARVLASICRSALSHRGHGKGMFINYDQLPEVVWNSLLEFFNVSYDNEDIERIKEAVKFDAKDPSMPFDPNAPQRGQAPSELVVQASDMWLGDLYHELQVAAGRM